MDRLLILHQSPLTNQEKGAIESIQQTAAATAVFTLKKMVWSQEEIDAFKARMHQGEGNVAKVDDFVNQAQEQQSPRRSLTNSPRKWNPTPTDENRRSDDWIGTGSPTGKKRSWTVKSVKPVIPNMDD